MNLPYTKLILLIILILIVLIYDFKKLGFNFKKLKERTVIFFVKVFAVIIEFISFAFGISLIGCAFNLNQEICQSEEISFIILGLGIAFIILGVIGYLVVFKIKKFDLNVLKSNFF